MRTGSIYIIKNTVNDKVYIGQTTMAVHERFMVHMKPSTAKLRRNYKLYNAVTKYGRDKSLGCHTYTVCRALDKAGSRKHRVPINNRDDLNISAIVDAYNAQMPMQELCDKFGITKPCSTELKNP
jgi:hypothetical protein